MYSVSTWAEDLAIEETLGIPPELLNDDRIARTLDALDPHIQGIEAAIAVNAITEFKVGTKLIHWDITTLLFHGEYDESEIVKFGYSRDHRPDKKQVATGLDVTHEGVPLMHEIYPGNTPDQKTVELNMKALQASLKESTFIVVGDRKMLEGENLKAMVKMQVRGDAQTQQQAKGHGGIRSRGGLRGTQLQGHKRGQVLRG
jgi:transposase